ncbi:hypothetical protein K1T35_26230 [Pseudonocardia sp. DSM 110487]|uniref:hypothetical protein n=1 Tax=Pseudonocardia sp. DSM 110487 TaxID=2865833 RepID=UPI001C6A0E3B|nr:hypothetical protein [Pseudonocardia sp. DSM 110487]QYN32110.1 hypothetical protein K1T35_26230 [Pseudonocardia sp. DSM 110487]
MHEWLAELAAWAWERHHNVLSWYIRPLFFLPFCFFAYRRSWPGIVVTLLALATSMAWFPAPARPEPGVIQMLQVERDYLLGEWTAAKIAMSLLVPLIFLGVAAALWRRSFGWAMVVINGAFLFKIAWTFFYDADGSGAQAHLQAVLIGMLLVDAGLLAGARRHASRSRARMVARPPEGTAGAP